MKETLSFKVNYKEAIERLGDRELYTEVAHSFGGHITDIIQEIDSALDANDYKTSNRLAHSLKSNCAAMGSEELRVACYSLEKECLAENGEKAKELFVMLKPALLSFKDILLEIK